MLCPVCRSEYSNGDSACPHCSNPPVVLPGEPEAGLHEFVEVMLVFEEGHISLIKSIFDDAELDYYLHGDASHLLVPLPLSTRLMVRQDQAAEARQILAELGLI